MKSLKGLFYLLATVCFACSCTDNIEEPKNTGGITGVVADKTTGDPISTVSLNLSPGGKKTVTGSDGSFQFTELDAGSYTIDLEKEGYKKESSSVVVFEGKQTESHLLLERVASVIKADRDVLDFGDNAGVTQLSVSIVNSGFLDLHWSVSWDSQVKWIREVLGPDGKSEGTLGFGKTASLVIRIDRDALANGYNETVIVIWSDNGRSELKVTATGADRRMATTNVWPVTDIQTTSATLNAEVTSKGSPEYTERGFVISTSTIDAEADIAGLRKVSVALNSELKYSATVNELSKGVRYYVRAYAINAIGTKLSTNQVDFTTIETITSVKTLDYSALDVINGTVQFNGQIEVAGQPVYTEKGFVYNTSGEPTIDNGTKVTVSGNGSGEYSYSCAGLSSQTTYYVRAYAIQNNAVIYGTTINFSTNQDATEVKTSGATSITATSATLNGSVTKAGIPEFTERGFCYSKSNTSPELSDTKKVVTGNTTGNYSATIDGLSYNTTYYYRAYAMQNGKPVYGGVVSFTTEFTKTEVTTSGATNVTPSSATLNGAISKKGSPTYTEKGFCYSTSSSPTINDTKVTVSGTGEGNYSTNISGLSYNTAYYYRAYAIQDGEPVYGKVIYFKSGYTETVVETNSNVTNIKYDQATLGFAVRIVGEPACTEAGICYGTSSTPTTNSNKVTGTANATFNQSKTITGLDEGTTYYFRAYAIQDGYPVYGTIFSFKTAERPSVSTSSASNLQNPYGMMNMWQIQLNGRVNSAGNPSITGRGFKYSASGDPESSGTTVSASGSSTGNFSASLSGLKSNTTYYVRAYVKNSLGYVYGNLITFTTGN